MVDFVVVVWAEVGAAVVGEVLVVETVVVGLVVVVDGIDFVEYDGLWLAAFTVVLL